MKISDHQETVDKIEAVFSTEQSFSFPKTGIINLDPPISTKKISIMLNSNLATGLGKITIKTIGKLSDLKSFYIE